MTPFDIELQVFQSGDFWFQVILPMAIALFFGFLIGLERQNIGKSAGISAHILIAMSTAVIGIVQLYMYKAQGADSSADNQRLIAQVLPGVGFIGAGVIMKGGKTIIGLTTAATIWATAMMGLVAGSGYYITASIFGTFLVLFIYLRDMKRGINPFIPHVHHDFLESDIDIEDDDKRRHA